MSEKPIPFNAPMVRAVLAGTKTQTRRVVKNINPTLLASNPEPHQIANALRCPYGQPGDRLWVREAWARNANQLSDSHMDTSLVYRADDKGRALDNGTEKPWTPAIHMPRWDSRITLEVTGVRVERLQDISEADAQAEGAPSADLASGRECIFPHQGTYRWGFRLLWESINGPSSWGSNPWVWCVSFRRVQP